MEWFQRIYQQIQPGDYPWLWEVFVVILLTLIANAVAKLVLRHFQHKFEQTRNVWDDALLAAAQRPAAYLIWVVGFSWALEIVSATADATIFEAVGPAREVAVVGLLTWFVVSLIGQVEQRLLRRQGGTEERMDQTTVMALSKLLRAAVIITAVLVVMQSLGFSISGVLAFGGIGGIAAGFAAKDLLANFFGGLMVYLDRPFVVGNWVRSPDKEIEGTVEHIGWRLTRIRTFDQRPLYVPNATFMQISVENPSRMLNRRIYETIGLRYQDAQQVRGVIDTVRTMLEQHEDIDQNQTLIVNFNSFGPHSLDFFVYTFTRTTQWVQYHAVKQDVLLKILDIVHQHGADVAFPTSTLHFGEPLKLQSDIDDIPDTDKRKAELTRQSQQERV